jgi:hypothetical protein
MEVTELTDEEKKFIIMCIRGVNFSGNLKHLAQTLIMAESVIKKLYTHDEPEEHH